MRAVVFVPSIVVFFTTLPFNKTETRVDVMGEPPSHGESQLTLSAPLSVVVITCDG